MRNALIIIFSLMIIHSFGRVKNSIYNNVSNSARIVTTDTTVFIPVVVHVIASGQPNETFPTDAAIIAKIAELNSIFNGSASFLGDNLNIGIQFRLATLSPNCTSTNGIDRLNYQTNIQYKNSGVQFETSSGISEIELKMNTRWETSQYLNIWIVNKIDGVNSGAYTWMPAEAAGKDGIIITSSDFMLPNFHLLVNQMGRFFNLYDLWEKLVPGASVFCGDDDVIDTDKVEAYSGPARTGINPCTTNPYDVRTEYNFMSHNNIRRQFTQGQKVRMRGALQLPNRKSLVNSITDEFSSCIFNNANTPVFTHNTAPVNLFKTLGIGKGGYIYAGTANQGLYKFNGHKWTKLSILSNTLGSNNIGDIKTDKNGGIWIAQYGHSTTQAITGGLNYLPDSTEIGHIQYSPETGGLPTRYCRGVFVDTSSIQVNPRVWTANFAQTTAGSNPTGGAVGLGLNSTSPNFTSITAGIDISTQTTSVQTIGGDNNEVWAFVSGNFNKNQILSYNSQTAAFKKAYNNTDIHASLATNFLVRAILFEKYKYFDEINLIDKVTDRRWVAVGNGGVLVYEKPLNQVVEGTWTYVSPTTHPTKFPSGSFVNTNSITSDEAGNIYFGTNQGLVVFTGGDVADSSNYQRFTTVEGLPSNNVLDIVDAPHLGRIIISTAEGIVFWSKEKIKKDFSKYTINNLAENFNQNHYTVPREAAIHHYFIVKDKQGNRQKGTHIIYKLSNSPNYIFYSEESDENGLIDLYLPVGGGDVNISTDDYIPAGSSNVTISFDKIIDADFLEIKDIGTNSFSNFTILVIDKAEPIEEEFGLGFELGAGAEIKDGGEINAGVFKIEGGYASLGIGGSYSPSLTFTPDANHPNIWQTKISSPFGVKATGSLGPKIQGEIGKFASTGGLYGEVEPSVSTVEEYTYNLDITNNSHLYFLGANIFSLGTKLTPGGLMVSNVLFRLANFSNLAKSEKYGFNLGVKGTANLNSSLGISKKITSKKLNLDGEIGLEIGGSVTGTYETNFEFSTEIIQNEGANISTTLSADRSLNIGIELGIGLEEKDKYTERDYDKKKNNLKLPFEFTPYSNQDKYSITLNRHLTAIGGSLTDASVSFSNEDEIEIETNTYKIEKKNKIQYSSTAINKIGSLASNYIYDFFKNGNSINSSVSLAKTSFSGSKSSFKQIKDYHSNIFSKPGTFISSDFEISNTREISSSYDKTFEFGATLFVGVDIEVGFKEWNKYVHSFKDYKYSKESNSMLPVLDYPDIETNIQLPNQTPLSQTRLVSVLSSIQSNIANTSTSVLNAAKSFVTQVASLVTNVATIFSNNQNGTVQRLMLDATPFKVSAQKSPQTSTPSVFTFSIPSGNQAFNTGTNLLFKYYYPENQLQAITSTDTFKIITDVFFLNAMNGTTDLNTAPNGNFTINSQFSNYELELAGLPNNLTPEVLFLPNGSTTWEVIGAANQTINFNRLGVFAIGVALQKDFVPPTIIITPPPSFIDGQLFTVSMTDNLSGIDWTKTYFICNGKIIPYQRIGSSNTINLDISLLHESPVQTPEIFDIEVRTIDLAGNKKNFFQTYPCKKSIQLLNIVGGSTSTLNKHQALETIEVSGSSVIPPSIELKAGKSVILSPGFNTENTGGYFKAEIGGCNSSNLPAQPANFTVSSAAVCKGQTGIVYTIPNEAGITYNWSYSGTGATINGTSNSITIDFANNATSGNLSVTATNNAGTSPARTLGIITNSPSNPPTTIAKSIGIGTSTSLVATGCLTYKWYDQVTNGTLLFTGNTFITPTLNANTTYYVACSDSPCPETTRTPLLVSVGAVPAQPSPIVGGATACQGRSGLTYLVTAVAGATSYTWTYSGTGVTFVGGINNTRTITLDFSYTATAGILSVTANNAYGSSVPQTMAIGISPAPPAPTASGVTITSGSAANLSATGCSIYKWYSQPTLGTAIHTGQNFTTLPLNTSTTYYAACNNGTSCESPRVPVLVTVQ